MKFGNIVNSIILIHLTSLLIQTATFSIWHRLSRAVPGETVQKRTEHVRFRIKGVERGMLEISNFDHSLLVKDWTLHTQSSEDESWFSFCDDDSLVSEIGHKNVLQLCRAGHPLEKLVLDRSEPFKSNLMFREPVGEDEIIEAVIYENQRFYLRPSQHHKEVVVASIEGSIGFGSIGMTGIHSHVEVVRPHHLRNIERENFKYITWQIVMITKS